MSNARTRTPSAAPPPRVKDLPRRRRCPTITGRGFAASFRAVLSGALPGVTNPRPALRLFRRKPTRTVHAHSSLVIPGLSEAESPEPRGQHTCFVTPWVPGPRCARPGMTKRKSSRHPPSAQRKSRGPKPAAEVNREETPDRAGAVSRNTATPQTYSRAQQFSR